MVSYQLTPALYKLPQNDPPKRNDVVMKTLAGPRKPKGKNRIRLQRSPARSERRALPPMAAYQDMIGALILAVSITAVRLRLVLRMVHCRPGRDRAGRLLRLAHA
jgi:hypothetical protein